MPGQLAATKEIENRLSSIEFSDPKGVYEICKENTNIFKDALVFICVNRQKIMELVGNSCCSYDYTGISVRTDFK